MSRVVVNQEFLPDPHAVVVRAPDGTVVGRWAEDEPLVENVATGVTKGGEMPGGHKEFGCVLARDPRLAFPDLSTYSKIEYQGPGGEVVWSGSLMRAPRTDGDHLVIGPEAAGDSSFLDDDEGVVGPGFIDSVLSKLTGPSTQRRANVLGESGANGPYAYSMEETVGISGTGALPAGVIFTLGSITDGQTEFAEQYYNGGGVDIGALLYDFRELAGFPKDSDFVDYAVLCSDDLDTEVDIGFNHAQETALEQRLNASVAGRKYAKVQCTYNGKVEGVNQRNSRGWLNLKVIADHGLTLQGEWPHVGFTVKQMLPLVAEIAGLRTTEESLEDNGFVIPQAWFSDPGPMSRVVAEITKYELLDWFVFEDKLLQCRKPGTYGRRWQAYAGPSGLKNTGQDGTRIWDEITVQWGDVDGSTKTAGPPGSGAMFIDERLRLTDPNNAAVAANRPRKKLLVLNGTCVESTAVLTAVRFLEEAARLDHSGEATITDYVMDEHGIWMPSSYMQPGDEIRFPDAADPSYRKITAQPYTRETKTASLSLDAPPEGLAALEERFNAKLIELGIGS